MKISREFQSNVMSIVENEPSLAFFKKDIENGLFTLSELTEIEQGSSSPGTQIFLSVYAVYGCGLNKEAGKWLFGCMYQLIDFTIISIDKSLLKKLKKRH